jgi:hypothetical protein
MSVLPTKEEVVDAHKRIKELFLDGFKDEIKSHLDEKHTYMYGKNKSIWRATEQLGINKELAIYVLMGSNRRQESWSKIEEKFDLKPLREVLTPLLVELAREVNRGNYYKISFTDRDKYDGNFKLRVDIKPLNKKDDSSEDSMGFRKIKSKSTLKEDKTLEKLQRELAIEKAKVALLKEKNKKNSS